MYICICNAVTDSEIRECVRLGATTLEDLSGQLGVATCCGTCAECANSLITESVAAAAGGQLVDA